MYQALPDYLARQGYHLEVVPERRERPGYYVIDGVPQKRLAWFTGLEWFVPPGTRNAAE